MTNPVSVKSKRLSVVKPSTIYHLPSTNPGFTIVELLVVIVVIGILAAITIVAYTGISARANVASLQSDLNSAKKQLSLYYVDHGFYPASIDVTTKCPKDSGGTADTKYCLKSSNGTTFTHYPLGALTKPDGFGLKASSGTTTYTITNTSSPVVMSTLVVSDPTNWLAIGLQVWAKANLNVGTRINGALAQTNNGGTNTVEKYCYGDTDAGCTNTDLNGIAYGGLYQWDEAMKYVVTEGAQGICPTGSHIPSDNDWKILEMQRGMTQAQADIADVRRGTDQGTQLKPGGSSGLNIPLAGYRYSDGSFGGLASDGFSWSSSESSTSARNRYLYSGDATVYRFADGKGYGYSVRCLGN